MNKPPSDKMTQSERLSETARALGCDEDEAAFREKLRVVARQKPKKDAEKPEPLLRERSLLATDHDG